MHKREYRSMKHLHNLSRQTAPALAQDDSFALFLSIASAFLSFFIKVGSRS